MNRSLVECFVDVLVATEDLRTEDTAKSFDVAAHVRSLSGKLDRASRCALAQGHGTDAVDLARFAVCAWADEVLLDLARHRGPLTRSHGLLQRRYYDTADAGLLFFQYMEQHAPGNEQVLEVFRLCLALGFRGARERGASTVIRDVTPYLPPAGPWRRASGAMLRYRYHSVVMRLLLSLLQVSLLLYCGWALLDGTLAARVAALAGNGPGSG